MNLVALCPWKPQHPAVLTGLQTAVRDRWLQVVVSRDREHSFSVFWDLTGMNWPGSYGRFCCQMLARLLQQICLHSKSKLEPVREKRFSFYMSSGFSAEASSVVWAKPVKWGQGGIEILNNNIKTAWNISIFQKFYPFFCNQPSVSSTRHLYIYRYDNRHIKSEVKKVVDADLWNVADIFGGKHHLDHHEADGLSYHGVWISFLDTKWLSCGHSCVWLQSQLIVQYPISHQSILISLLSSMASCHLNKAAC